LEIKNNLPMGTSGAKISTGTDPTTVVSGHRKTATNEMIIVN